MERLHGMNPNNLIKCLECGKELKMITNTHLKTHGLTEIDYKLKYNIKQLSSVDRTSKISKTMISKLYKGKTLQDRYKMTKEEYESLKNTISSTVSKTMNTPEMKKMSSDRILKTISSGKMPKAYTRPARTLVQAMKDTGIWNIDWKEEQIVGTYCIDIINKKLKIVICVDGDYWHYNSKTIKNSNLSKAQKRNINLDKTRDSYLKNRGWIVLHFWESEIYNNLEFCLTDIINSTTNMPTSSFNYYWNDKNKLNTVMQMY